MTCDDLDMMLAHRATGDLSHDEGDRLRRHLASCPSCAESAWQFERRMSDMHALAGHLATVEPPAELPTVESPAPSTAWRRTLVRTAIAGLSAAAAIMLIASLSVQDSGLVTPSPTPINVADAPIKKEYRTPRFALRTDAERLQPPSARSRPRVPSFASPVSGRDGSVRFRTASMVIKERKSHVDALDWKP